MRVFFCLFLSLCISCSKTDTDNINSCTPAEFDESKYNSNQNFGLNLIEYNLEGLCLSVSLGVSGCDDNHTIDMVSDGLVQQTQIELVEFDFYDNNPQACEAYFIIKRDFDLTPIQERYTVPVVVNFRGNIGSINLE